MAAGRRVGGAWAAKKRARAEAYKAVQASGGALPQRVIEVPVCAGCGRHQPGARCTNYRCSKCCLRLGGCPQHVP